jgi:photosystem II stability/assembly factor-like uncharacterized protein
MRCSLIALAFATMLVVAGCGGAAPKNTPTSVSPPVGGPVPTGFAPVSVAALSGREFWLVGSSHATIVRTTDGGAHFVSIPAPRGIDTVRFATQLDGYAFNDEAFANANGSPAPVYVTTDGGGDWRRTPLRNVVAFTTGGGLAYAVTGGCENGACGQLQLERAPVGKDAWTSQVLPGGPFEPTVVLAAHGRTLWLSLSATGNPGAHQTLLTSTDAGATLHSGKSPCYTGLGGSIAPASDSVLWAVCPTGMLSGALRSADGGAAWSPLKATREFANSARITAASATTALIATGDQSELLRTTDAGATFTRVYPVSAGGWSSLAFADAQTVLALRFASSGPLQLYRSTDAGTGWSGPIAIR